MFGRPCLAIWVRTLGFECGSKDRLNARMSSQKRSSQALEENPHVIFRANSNCFGSGGTYYYRFLAEKARVKSANGLVLY